MKRSRGVSAAAVVLLISSVAVAFAAAIAGFAIPAISLSRGSTFALRNSIDLWLFAALVGGWGIATAIGIWRLRPWARISVLTIGVVLIFVGGFLSFVAFVVHISASAADPHVVSLARAFILSMFFVPTLVGVWWLLLFRRAYVAQQFDKPGRGPVSISVIGVYLLASIPFLLLLQTVTPHHVVPGFGRALMGRKFVVYFAFWTAVHLVLGIGLLSWKAWTHMATVLYLLLYIVADSYTLFFRNAATLFSFKDSANVLIGRFALGWGAISIAVALYFLFTRRRAYRAACEARMRAV